MSFRTNWRTDPQKPILYTELDIDFKHGCRIEPNLEVMQTNFHAAVQVCTEINYFVTTWGRQAKTYERRLRRVTVGGFLNSIEFSYRDFKLINL